MKIACLSVFISLFFSVMVLSQSSEKSIYDFAINSIDGELIKFDKYKGKYILIVNTATRCGLKGQYKTLDKLYKEHRNKLVVLGFPANNFLSQEPGTNEEIKEICRKNHGVTFDMFEKISVKGKDAHELYIWLKEKTGKSPSWNFAKYLISKDGKDVTYFGPQVRPLGKNIAKKLEE